MGRNWLRYARPSLLGVPLQEISKRLRVPSNFLFPSAGKRASRWFGRDWLRYARPSLFGCSFARNKNAVAFFLFGIGFALLAHPFWEFLCKKQERCRVFLVWDWLRFARPSLLGVPLQETRTLSRFSCFAFYPLCEQAPRRA